MTTALTSDTLLGLRDEILALPGVAGLHGGTFGELATYLPGQRVHGIVHRRAGIEVHLIAAAPQELDLDLHALGAVVAGLVDQRTGLPCQVFIADLRTPAEGGTP